jgi:hypothetical protein
MWNFYPSIHPFIHYFIISLIEFGFVANCADLPAWLVGWLVLQFYITFQKCPQLDGKHVVIGQVTEGLEVLKAIDDRSGTEDGQVQKLL